MTSSLFERLERLAIPYQRCDHPAVFTTAEAEQWVPPMPGVKAKNLFLADTRSTRLFMVVVPYEKRVDLAALAAALQVRKLSFASSDTMQEVLGVTPGAVSILGVANDHEGRVELVVDRSIWEAGALQCHPLINTATVSIALDDIRKLLVDTGHEARVIEVPSRPASA
jgi:Ala-tRNA(Pro) deacylase